VFCTTTDFFYTTVPQLTSMRN